MRPTRRPHSRLVNRPSPGGFFTRLLDPIDWLTQTIYTVLVMMTFTLTFRIILSDPASASLTESKIGEAVLAAAGATLAWGMIDGVMYALLSVFERSERHRMLNRIQAASNEEEGVEVIAEELDHILEPITSDEKRRLLYQDVLDHLRSSQPKPVGLRREDVAGAIGSLLVTIVAMLPALVPMLLLQRHPLLALRASSVVSFGVLFVCGYAWGQYTGSNPWRTGFLVMLVGAILVTIAILLGG